MKHLAIVLMMLLAAHASAQTFETLMQKGAGADVRGKTKKAARRYQAAFEAARTAEERVAALLAYTDAVRGAQANRELDDVLAAAIDDAYRRALAEATAKTAFKAHNDYGVFLLDRDDAKGAVAVMQRVEANVDIMPASTGARYLSNLGLAYFRADRFDEALQTYRRAIEKDPSFDVPAVAAASAIERLEPERAAAETKALRELLRKHGREEGNASIPMNLYVDDSPNLPAAFDTDIEKLYAHLTAEAERRHVALRLREAGDAVAAKNPQRAAGLYIAAWKLDTLDVEPLTHLADLLSGWKGEESDKLLDEMMAKLFHQREPLYTRDPMAEVRLHMILGSIFETKKEWGPRTAPRSAAYQYEAAFHAYERVRGASRDVPNYPGLHASYAAALVRVDDKEGAWRQYLNAALASYRSGDLKNAATMLRLCDSVGYRASAKEQELLLATRTVIDNGTSNAAWP